MSCFDDGNCNAVQIEYDGNGILTQYPFPFPYEDELEVHVEKWDAVNFRYNRINRDQWSFDNLTTIKFETAPDYTFRIMRETDLEEMEVTFYPGSSIRAQDLNANFEQLQHAIQEGWCRVSDEFYCYLDEFIFDKRDAWTKKEQLDGDVELKGEKIFLDEAIAARHDTYLQDNKPTQPTYEQGGKRWYDTDKVLNYIWNDQIEAWVDYNLAGPQGPKGADGHHIVMISMSPPDKRPNGDPLKNGDMWFNNCTGETWIRYDETWITLVNGGPKGPQGPKGDKGDDSTVEGPEGPKGDQGETGTFKTICSTSAPEKRDDDTELQCGDMWFNTCTGELYVYYSGNWLGISDATGPQGPQGEQGPQGPAGKPGEDGEDGEDGEPGNKGHIGDTPPADPEVGDWWFDTNCPSGQYIWDGTQWVGTSIPGPPGPPGQDGVDGGISVDVDPVTITGEPGTPADVTNTGDTVNAVFQFTIPRGDKGEKGEPGEDGEDGQDGSNGSDGADGTAATVDVGETTTSGPGTDANVVNSGNTTNAIFDFTIPRGDPGNQGLIGDTPPVEPEVGDWWFDTKCESQQYIWDGTQWVGTSVPGPRGADGKTAHVGDKPIDAPLIGNLWFDTKCETQGLYAFDGTYWVEVTKPGKDGGGSVRTEGETLNFIAPLQKSGNDVSFSWTSLNALT